MTSPYLDYAATTPLDPRVVAVMAEVQSQPMRYANASSQHPPGRAAADRVDAAGKQVLQAIGVPDYELVWTSGATEADNLAILGLARALEVRKSPRRRILVLAIEHSAVLAAARAATAHGFTIEMVPVDAKGMIDIAALQSLLDDDVALVSVGLVNNETGVIQPIEPVADAVHAAGALLHVDAAQAAGRLPPSTGFARADLLVVSAHKFYGPMGVGALCYRPDIRLEPLMHGGGQQGGLRSGTLPVPLIVGMGEALSSVDSAEEAQRQYQLRDRLLGALGALGGVVMNSPQAGSPHILNVSFAGVHGGALRSALNDLAVGFGSACNSTGGPSHVLRAMGRPDILAHASLRISLGRFTDQGDIDTASAQIVPVVEALRRISPLWREICEGRALEDVYGVTTPLPVA